MEKIPSEKELAELLGQPLYDVWMALCALVDEKYEMERLWNAGGKEWTYEYKYRRGGKTLCALYAGKDRMGFMVILGREEREKFEAARAAYSEAVQKAYDDSKTYHDGKWIMFFPTDRSTFPDLEKLLLLKRRPNRNHNKR